MLVCPACQTRHQTLRDLLTCCPRELRRLMEALYGDRSGDLFRALLSGKPLPPRVRRSMVDNTPQEAA